jgi:hypothetical protein
MANEYKRLGALRPADANDAQLYAVPTDERAMVVVFVCNQTGTAATFRLAHLDSGTTPANEDWMYYDYSLAANTTLKIGPIAMNESESLRVRSGTADAISFVASGMES